MLQVAPVSRKTAQAYVRKHHRHHGPSIGDKFCLGALNHDLELVGVAVVGRPVARGLDDGWTLEVTRLATDGTRNACSLLYGAAARAAKAMGFRRIVTYTLEDERGSSLRAAGWTLDGLVQGRSWDTASRPRKDVSPTCNKRRWVKTLGVAPKSPPPVVLAESYQETMF